MSPLQLSASFYSAKKCSVKDGEHSSRFFTAHLFAGHAFEVHSRRRLLQHTSLKAIHWANITNKHVTFTTIR
jgi:hypothetical protein